MIKNLFSPSTLASAGLGVPVAIVVAWLVSLWGKEMPSEVQMALGAIISTVVGYFFPGGKGTDLAQK